jgi:hypothetical protein
MADDVRDGATNWSISHICGVKAERTTDHGQATGKLYHMRLRVECTLFCNNWKMLKDWERTNNLKDIKSSAKIS